MGPFLVVVPLSTVPNWVREFRKWLPQLNSIVYVGDAASREVIFPSCCFCLSLPLGLNPGNSFHRLSSITWVGNAPSNVGDAAL